MRALKPDNITAAQDCAPDEAARGWAASGGAYFVTDHARQRAHERFHGLSLAVIVAEVEDALRAERIAVVRGENLRVWTADGQRFYAIRARPRYFVVKTTWKLEVDG